ncbi:hypothetical protein LINPERHAP2_LOCUS28806 [Linum perenne]
MKDVETIKDYSDRLLDIANRIRLLGSDFSDSRIVERGRGGPRKTFPPCKYCGRLGHGPARCWKRPDAKCTRCNQFGHETWLCRERFPKPELEANVVDQEEEAEDLFVASCHASQVSSESWLIDSGCTNHMTFDKALFRDLQPVAKVKVRLYLPDGRTKLVHANGKKFILAGETPKLYFRNSDASIKENLSWDVS